MSQIHNVDIKYNINISIDKLFPSDNVSGTRGKKLDINSLYSNTSLNNDPEITFNSNLLIEKRIRRRNEKLNFYKQMLKYCYKRIAESDDNLETDILFTVIENIPECKEYNPKECLEYISVKIREEDFDTTILSSTTMFITWKYLELKKENRK